MSNINQSQIQTAIFNALVGETTKQDRTAIEELDQRYRAGELPRGIAGGDIRGPTGTLGGPGPIGPKGIAGIPIPEDGSLRIHNRKQYNQNESQNLFQVIWTPLRGWISDFMMLKK
jgi:hypothetical protein